MRFGVRLLLPPRQPAMIRVFEPGETTADGKIVRSKTVHENTPTFQEAYRQAHGKDPSGPLWDAHKVLYNDVHTTLTRTLVLPPGTPPEVVNRLRKAIEKMKTIRNFARPAMIVGRYDPTVAAKKYPRIAAHETRRSGRTSPIKTNTISQR